MPLVINGEIESSRLRSFEEFSRKHEHFRESARNFCKKPQRRVKRPSRVLYIIQREYATVAQDDEPITIMGSEDATTCHIVVLQNTGSGVVSLGHFDGRSTEEGIKGMIASVTNLSRSKCDANGRNELHLFGGFLDDRGISSGLTVSILEALQKQDEPIHLCSACVTGFNNVVESGQHKPIISGIGVSIQDGEIYPATFENKGPDEIIRHARVFVGDERMVEVYNSSNKELQIEPYDSKNKLPAKYLEFYCNADDKVILQNLSTSPHCEPPYFASTTRATFLHILTHPQPLITVFPEGKPRVYQLSDSEKNWTRTS
ncbi:protein N-terminal asparagine amidohydrolase [Pocillopora verrucosa]|uniref:protein N-terminal asparagine amidohydrolase n=1 Tax=Pocillopora verrucosa TaxID=203993 RepID=UPI00333F50B4